MLERNITAFIYPGPIGNPAICDGLCDDRELTMSLTDRGDGTVAVLLETAGDQRGYSLPPALLDGALHSLAAGLVRDSEAALFLPVGMRRIRCYSAAAGPIWCHAAWTHAEGESRTADLTLFEEDGLVVARQMRARAPFRMIGMVWRRQSARHEEFAALAGLIRRILSDGVSEVTIME